MCCQCFFSFFSFNLLIEKFKVNISLVCHLRKYQFNVVPFQLRNALSMFWFFLSRKIKGIYQLSVLPNIFGWYKNKFERKKIQREKKGQNFYFAFCLSWKVQTFFLVGIKKNILKKPTHLYLICLILIWNVCKIILSNFFS